MEREIDGKAGLKANSVTPAGSHRVLLRYGDQYEYVTLPEPPSRQ